jgi:Dienelactone hydrolase family
VIGYCMGGGFALLLAADRGFTVSSVNYGTAPKDAHTATFLRRACPIVGSYGGKDRSLRGAADRLDRTDGRRVGHDVKEYPQAGHAFLNDHEGAGDKTPLPFSVPEPVFGILCPGSGLPRGICTRCTPAHPRVLQSALETVEGRDAALHRGRASSICGFWSECALASRHQRPPFGRTSILRGGTERCTGSRAPSAWADLPPGVVTGCSLRRGTRIARSRRSRTRRSLARSRRTTRA